MEKNELFEYSEELLKKYFGEMLLKIYDAGFEAGVNSMKKGPEVINDKTINWIDLGLPSGNLWAKVDERSVYPSNDAYLPDRGDFSELLKCKFDLRYGIYIKGVNGHQLSLLDKAYGKLPYSKEHRYHIWIKSKLKEDLNREALILYLTDDDSSVGTREFSSEFSGSEGIVLYCKHQ